MGELWMFARRMLRRKVLLVSALTFAFLSAAGLGVGMVAMVPVLQNILGDDGKSLLAMAQDYNAGLGADSWRVIPQAILAELPDDRYKTVLFMMIGLGVLTIVGGFLSFMHMYSALNLVTLTVAEVRRDAFKTVIALPLGTVTKEGPSDLISRIVLDSQALTQGFMAMFSRALSQAPKGIVGLVVAIVLDWRMSLIALTVAPVLYTVIRRFGKKIRRSAKSSLDYQGQLYHSASEVLRGLRVVKVHTTERAEIGRFHRINRQVVKQELRARTARALSSPLVEMLTFLSLGTLVVIAGKAIIDGQLNPATFFVTLTGLAIAGSTLKPLTSVFNDMQQASGGAERLAVLMGLEPEEQQRGRPPLAPHVTDIELRDVVFRYEGADEPALNGVSFRVAHGETVAIVGPNGSGKTTTLSLIPRLFDPERGQVLVDGVDIKDVSMRSLRKQIAVVTQEVVLFKGTIASNICYGSPSATDATMKQAAQQARAEEFILDKPDGYDGHIGEDGAGLSGGQRQRISIARAILRDPDILLMDEATSMIDADSEAKIADTLAEFAQGRTSLIVAHRLSTVKNADRIIVMDQGTIVDEGVHADLLERCATYRLIADNQLVSAE